MVSEAQFHAGAKHQDVIRLEARTGVVSSLHKVILQLEQIKRGAGGSILAKDLEVKIDKALDDIEELLENIQEASDIELVKIDLSDLVKEIPENPKPPKDKNKYAYCNLKLPKQKKKIASIFQYQ